MTKTHIAAIVVVSIAAILLASFAAVQIRSRLSDPTATSTPVTTFPVSGTIPGSSRTDSETITVPIQQNHSLLTRNFIENGITIEDVENPGTYLLQGSLGYCEPGEICTAGSSTEFSVFYDLATGTFTIGLLEEPLGKARQDAQSYLQTTLGLTGEQLCSLNYYVGTTYTVNESYASKNLGFNGCDGATVLPL